MLTRAFDWIQRAVGLKIEGEHLEVKVSLTSEEAKDLHNSFQEISVMSNKVILKADYARDIDITIRIKGAWLQKYGDLTLDDGRTYLKVSGIPNYFMGMRNTTFNPQPYKEETGRYIGTELGLVYDSAEIIKVAVKEIRNETL